jgi:hypothetical protein
VSISLAGTAFYNAFATNQTTLAVSNVTVGNYRLISVKVSSGTAFPVTGISGGGVTTWTRLFAQVVPSVEPGNYEIWGGVVTATGAQTITVTFSATTAVQNELWSSELVWSGGVAASWSVVASGVNYGVSGVAWTFPSLTSAASGDQAYWGVSRGGGTAITGTTTTGFTAAAANANGNSSIFNGTLALSTTYTPVVTPTPTTAAWAEMGIIVQVRLVPLPRVRRPLFCRPPRL